MHKELVLKYSLRMASYNFQLYAKYRTYFSINIYIFSKMNMFSILKLIPNLDDNWVIQVCY
jgi:hypothetical protein